MRGKGGRKRVGQTWGNEIKRGWFSISRIVTSLLEGVQKGMTFEVWWGRHRKSWKRRGKTAEDRGESQNKKEEEEIEITSKSIFL